MKKKNQRLLRWSLLLQEYNLDIPGISEEKIILFLMPCLEHDDLSFPVTCCI